MLHDLAAAWSRRADELDARHDRDSNTPEQEHAENGDAREAAALRACATSLRTTLARAAATVVHLPDAAALAKGVDAWEILPDLRSTPPGRALVLVVPTMEDARDA